MKLYVASSWRNPYQPLTVEVLRQAGHEVYDFQHPPGGDHLGFSWSDVDPAWRSWQSSAYLEALQHPIAVAGFESDFTAMEWADAGVLLLPCGRSAHLEAGWFVGARKPLVIVLDEAEFPVPEGESNPELMYRMASAVVRGLDELLPTLTDVWNRYHRWSHAADASTDHDCYEWRCGCWGCDDLALRCPLWDERTCDGRIVAVPEPARG